MEERINIKEIVRKILDKWHYFAIILLIVMPLAWVYTEYATKVYLIKASILLNAEGKKGMDSEKFLKGMDLLASKTEIEDEMGLIKSFQIVENTLRRLDFGISYFTEADFRVTERYRGHFPFEIQLDSSVNQIVGVPIHIKRNSDATYKITISGDHAGTYNFRNHLPGESATNIETSAVVPIAEPYATDHLAFTIKFKSPHNPGDDTDYYFVINNLYSVAESYRDRLDIKPIARESNLVEISLKGSNPRKEVTFLNALLETYVRQDLDKRTQEGLRTIQFIDQQLTGVSDELRQAESSLESFRSRNNILDIETTAENLARNIDKLEDEKSLLELKLQYYQYIATSLDDGSNLSQIGTPSTFGLEDPLLNNLLMELSRLNQEKIGLSYSTKEGNPASEVVELKIANHKRTLVDNVNNFIAATTNALRDLDRRIAQVKARASTLPKSEREMVSIQRRFDFNDNVYGYLLEKKAEAGIAIASNTANKAVVDKPRQVGSGPIFPVKKWILLAAAVGSMFLGFGLVLFKDLMNDNIVTGTDIEKTTNIPFIGSISHASKKDRVSVNLAPSRTALAESFRSLSINLRYGAHEKGTNVIGLTSSVESEGKTFCSANLAATIAQSGRRTILIDADLRRSRVASMFKMRNDVGLSSYLMGRAGANEIIKNTHHRNLDVIPGGPVPPNPLDLLGSKIMEDLINELKANYDTIVIDSSPIGYVSEYLILMKYTNANIYVVRSNYTNKGHLDKINKLYRDKRIRNISILLNDTRTMTSKYYASN